MTSFIIKSIILGILAIVFMSIAIFCILMIEIKKKHSKITINLDMNSASVSDKNGKVSHQFNNISKLKVYFDSYHGRSWYLSLTYEMGYNRIVIKNEDGKQHRFIYIIESKSQFDELRNHFKTWVSKCDYNLRLLNRKT